MNNQITSLDGEQPIAIGEMSRRAGVSPSAIRGYEALGLLSQYGVRIMRIHNHRFFFASDVHKLRQIKIERINARDLYLAQIGRKQQHA